MDATDGRGSRFLLDGKTPANRPGFIKSVFQLELYPCDVELDFVSMEGNRNDLSSYRINTAILIVATIKPEPPGEGNSILPGACSVSDGAQTGPQRPRIGSVRIGSGRSALGPE